MAAASSGEPRSTSSPSSLYAQRDVLGGAEALEGVLPALDLHVGVAGGEQCHDADDDERDSGDP